MKTLLSFFLLIASFSCFAQFAIISDKDGFVNVRQENSASAKISDTLRNDHLIYCFENNGNWTNIDYTKHFKEKAGNGYVYKDRYKLISTYSKIPVSKQTSNTIVLLKDSLEISVTEESFDKTKHTLRFLKGQGSQIVFIDGKDYYGTDGELPKRQYRKIVVKVGQTIVTLPKEAIENLFEPDISSTQAYYDSKRNIIYLLSSNSDGAGSYEIIWKLENGIYKERLVAYGF